MKVLFNRFAALGAKTGVGHYTAELLGALERLAPEVIDPFPSGLTWKLGKLWGRLRPALSRAERRRDAARLGLKTRALHSIRSLGQAFLDRRFERTADARRFDVYHEPNFIPLPCEVPTVSTVHDLSVLLHPEWHPTGRVAYYEKRVPDLLKRTARFLAVSEFSRQEMIRHLGVEPSRVRTVYNGARPGLCALPARQVAAALARHGLKEGFLLHVGTIEPRKNLLMLMRAYCDLDPGVRERCPLVLAGNWGWNSDETWEYFNREAKHRGVRHIGYLDDDSLPALYNGARALLFPSLYEGFGLPPLEMAACGGAIIASTAEAVVEIVGTCAHLVHADDQSGWRDAIYRIIVDESWRDHLRRRSLGVAAAFTWERCAAETLAVYRELSQAAKPLRFAPGLEELRLSA